MKFAGRGHIAFSVIWLLLTISMQFPFRDTQEMIATIPAGLIIGFIFGAVIIGAVRLVKGTVHRARMLVSEQRSDSR